MSSCGCSGCLSFVDPLLRHCSRSSRSSACWRRSSARRRGRRAALVGTMAVAPRPRGTGDHRRRRRRRGAPPRRSSRWGTPTRRTSSCSVSAACCFSSGCAGSCCELVSHAVRVGGPLFARTSADALAARNRQLQRGASRGVGRPADQQQGAGDDVQRGSDVRSHDLALSDAERASRSPSLQLSDAEGKPQQPVLGPTWDRDARSLPPRVAR